MVSMPKYPAARPTLDEGQVLQRGGVGKQVFQRVLDLGLRATEPDTQLTDIQVVNSICDRLRLIAQA